MKDISNNLYWITVYMDRPLLKTQKHSTQNQKRSREVKLKFEFCISLGDYDKLRIKNYRLARPRYWTLEIRMRVITESYHSVKSFIFISIFICRILILPYRKITLQRVRRLYKEIETMYQNARQEHKGGLTWNCDKQNIRASARDNTG